MMSEISTSIYFWPIYEAGSQTKEIIELMSIYSKPIAIQSVECLGTSPSSWFICLYIDSVAVIEILVVILLNWATWHLNIDFCFLLEEWLNWYSFMVSSGRVIVDTLSIYMLRICRPYSSLNASPLVTNKKK